MGMGGLDVPAFVAYRRPRSTAAAARAPSSPTLKSPLSRYFSGNTNSGIYFSFTESLRSYSHTSERKDGVCYRPENGPRRKKHMNASFFPRSKKSAKSVFIALLGIVILLGTPDFHCINSPGGFEIHSEAMALEPKNGNTDSWPSSTTSTWPPSPTVSDRLMKSMSSPDNTNDLHSLKRSQPRYWDAMNGGTDEIAFANEKLIDHAVATISTMYYDSSGGFNFDTQEFYSKWNKLRHSTLRPHGSTGGNRERLNADESFGLDLGGTVSIASRESAVKTLKSIVASLNDPYSKYLTREELRKELEGGGDGFLGLGALVEGPVSSSPLSLPLAFEAKKSYRPSSSVNEFDRLSSRPWYGGQGGLSLQSYVGLAVPMLGSRGGVSQASLARINSVSYAANLPVVTAIIPDSPAERAGLVVGDRIASVGDIDFTRMSQHQIRKALKHKFFANEKEYFGRADLTIAKQVVVDNGFDQSEEKYVFENGWYVPNKNSQRTFDNRQVEQLLGYKLSHVKSIPTTLTANLEFPGIRQESHFPAVVGGDAIVHYEMLTADDSIFQQINNPAGSKPVGYIRLTRFSKSSTSGYIDAINSLEQAGAQSYIIDLRNNYGGVIQEAMLTASTLLRDPHSVLCYTLNSRGGFKPQENAEYIVDSKYPGYLLSTESSTVSRDQVRREHPDYLKDGGWSAPTSYASLNELKTTRGIKPAHSTSSLGLGAKKYTKGLEQSVAYFGREKIHFETLSDILAKSSQKKLVILINEGTASAAEVFASALRDNGRTVALIGTQTFGKGLIQHTFPMPDGGGLRLTVAEYLTPSLQHVTKVGSAKYDSGVKPDIWCESKHGIPQNIGADLCVGVALDALESEYD